MHWVKKYTQTIGMHMVTYALHDIATLSNNHPYIAVHGMGAVGNK